MRILVTSPSFLPQVGGLEIVTGTLARGLAARGHDVVVVTDTPAARDLREPFRCVVAPGAGEFLGLVRWSDVFYQANVSLRKLWPLALVRRPLVVSHHSWYRQPDGRQSPADWLKRWVTRCADASLPVSRALAEDLGGRQLVIENGYRDDVFRRDPAARRSLDILFVGRLVSDKGLDLLLDAVARLPPHLRLTVVGNGPERPALDGQVTRLGLEGRVCFAGELAPDALVRLYNAHELVVMPSRYREPYGIVALEAAACGCVVVGSGEGGLAEAIGPCGLTFQNGDVAGLAAALKRALDDAALRERCRAAAPAHLADRTAGAMLARYERVFERTVQR